MFACKNYELEIYNFCLLFFLILTQWMDKEMREYSVNLLVNDYKKFI